MGANISVQKLVKSRQECVVLHFTTLENDFKIAVTAEPKLRLVVNGLTLATLEGETGAVKSLPSKDELLAVLSETNIVADDKALLVRTYSKFRLRLLAAVTARNPHDYVARNCC